MQAKIVNLESKKIAGYLHKCSHNNNTIPKFWQDVFADGRHTKLHGQDFVKSHGDYGVCYDEGENLCYLLGLEVKDGADVPGEFEQRDLSAGEYAVWPVKKMEFMDAWSSLTKWINESAEYNHAPSAESFELYKCECSNDVMCEACKSDNFCDVYIKVVKK